MLKHFVLVVSLLAGAFTAHAEQIYDAAPAVTKIPEFRLAKSFFISNRGISSVKQVPSSPRHYFVSSGDSAVRLFDICTGEVAWEYFRPGPDTYQPFLVVSSTGRYVATNDPLNRVFVIDGTTGKEVQAIRFREDDYTNLPGSAYFSRDDRYIYIGHNEVISQMDLVSGTKVRDYRNAAASHQGAGLTVLENGDISFLSPQSWSLLKWTTDGTEKPYAMIELKENFHIFDSLDLQAGRFFAANAFDGQGTVFVDATTGERLQTLRLPRAYIGEVLVSADQSISYVAGYDHTITLFETRTGRELSSFLLVDPDGEPASARAIALNADANFLVAGLENGYLNIYDVGDRYKTNMCRQ